METFVARTASVSSFATMYQSMLIVNATRQKCFIAHGALVWPVFAEENNNNNNNEKLEFRHIQNRLITMTDRSPV